jgi:hypothetical protein
MDFGGAGHIPLSKHVADDLEQYPQWRSHLPRNCWRNIVNCFAKSSRACASMSEHRIMSEKPSFFAELKRRNVYKVAVAYAVVGWLTIQAASIVLPTFHAPEWTCKPSLAW